MKIVLNGLVMNDGTLDANGCLWYVDAMDGWDSPALRQSMLDPSLRDGQILTDSRFGSRTVTLTGVCKAPSEEAFWDAYNLFPTLVGMTDAVDLVVSENVDKRLSVKRTGTTKIGFVGVGAFKWSLQLLAEDPRKYAVSPTSVTIASGGSQSVTNLGNAPSYPTLTTSGTLTVTNTTAGQAIMTASGQSLPSGTVIDMNSRTVLQGTTSHYAKINPLASWWPILPGENTVSNTGSASVDLSFYDAWI